MLHHAPGPPAANDVHDGDRGRPRLVRVLTLALLVLVVWIDQSAFPLAVAVEHPDGAFESAFEHFFLNGSRAGVEWLYTYGPLGVLQSHFYNPELFLGRLVWGDLLWRGICALVFVLALWFHAKPFDRSVALVALILLPTCDDGFQYLFTLAAAELCLARPRSDARAAASALALVPASLGKFTAFALGIPVVAAIAFARWRSVSRRAALTFLGGWIVFWLALWLVVCRQSLLDVPHFIARSFDMASSYAQTMGAECPADVQTLALWVAASTLACLLAPLAFHARDAVTLARAVVRSAVLAAAFKAGLVRADHAWIFFTFAALTAFVCADGQSSHSVHRLHTAWRAALGLLRYVTLVLASIGVVRSSGLDRDVMAQLASRAGNQVDLFWKLSTRFFELRSELDAERAEAREQRALPRIRALVGNDTVDIHAPFQETVLLNDMNWRPRPVFQSYAVLSERLQQMNARFFESERAPRWFLLLPRAIDGRLETMEDAAALQVIARDYRPVAFERDYLLLRREPRPDTPLTRAVVIDRELRFGETLDLSGLDDSVHLLQLDVSSTWRGKLRALALRPAEIHARLTGSGGRAITVRLVPRMLVSGAIIDPMLVDTDDWTRWYAGTAERTRSLELLPSDPAWAYPESVRVRISKSALEPAFVDLVGERRIEYPGFGSLPDAYHSSVPSEPREEHGQHVVRVGTPSVLRFRVSAGPHRVTGALGLSAEATDPGASDGVTFQAHFEPVPRRARKVFERNVDPRSEVADRGYLAFEFQFEAESAGELILCTRPGPRLDGRDDLAFWSRVRIE